MEGIPHMDKKAIEKLNKLPEDSQLLAALQVGVKDEAMRTALDAVLYDKRLTNPQARIIVASLLQLYRDEQKRKAQESSRDGKVRVRAHLNETTTYTFVEPTRRRKKRLHRLERLSIEDMAATIGIAAQDLHEWAERGDLELFPDGTTNLFYVWECATQAMGTPSPDVKHIVAQMHAYATPRLYEGGIPEEAMAQFDHILHRIRRANATQAQAMVHALRTTSAPVTGRVEPMTTRGRIPGDMADRLVRRWTRTRVNEGVYRITHDRTRKYALACIAFLGTRRPPTDVQRHGDGYINLTIWCLEHDYHPDTGVYQRCRDLRDRLPFLYACGLLHEGQRDEVNVAKVLYKVWKGNANRAYAILERQSLTNASFRRAFWKLDDDGNGDAVPPEIGDVITPEIGDAIAHEIDRRHADDRAPEIGGRRRPQQRRRDD